MTAALHLLAALLFGAAVVVGRCALLLAPWGRLARRMARWAFALAGAATRARSAARRAS